MSLNKQCEKYTLIKSLIVFDCILFISIIPILMLSMVPAANKILIISGYDKIYHGQVNVEQYPWNRDKEKG